MFASSQPLVPCATTVMMPLPPAPIAIHRLSLIKCYVTRIGAIII